MTIEPRQVKYLNLSGEFLGNLERNKIEQIGEDVERYRQDFTVIEQFSYLKKIVG